MKWKVELWGYLAAFQISTVSILYLFFDANIFLAFILGLHPSVPYYWGYWLLSHQLFGRASRRHWFVYQFTA